VKILERNRVYQAVILAGGFGTRFSEETSRIPKPMIEIGGMPILWHIMKNYSHHGINDFIICLGYKGNIIKQFFDDYAMLNSDLRIDLEAKETVVLTSRSEPWKITLVDTGLNSMTGGRLATVGTYLEPNKPFLMTYGDGVGNVDISSLIKYHIRHGKKATVTAVTPPGRFGVLDIVEGSVHGFREKFASDQYKINAGFFVLEKSVLDYIEASDTVWEKEPMEKLAQDGELMAWDHTGFWMPMDTLRDKQSLEQKWFSGSAPWKVW